MSGLTTEEINDMSFALRALEMLSEKQITLVKLREGEYILRLTDGQISNETFPTSLLAAHAAYHS